MEEENNRIRKLTEPEKEKLKLLTKFRISTSLLEPTENGLKKSILDATAPVRSFLKTYNIHDYDLQGQGGNNKVFIPTIFYENSRVIKSKTSLYRPETKNGDPRIWPYGLSEICKPNDIIALIFFDSSLHILNLTKTDLNFTINSEITSPLKELLHEIRHLENSVAFELLAMLKKLMRNGPIPSLLKADTSVGRTLETALGININSSKRPDFKGIEIKSFRSERNNRKTLFAQVPNWKISKFKSSAEILDTFGYFRDGYQKLNCTVSTINTNSQGLSLNLESKLEQLIEYSDNPTIGNFAIWTLEKLHKRLSEKHKETFWIMADSLTIEGKEYFNYKLVEHTKRPIISQFDLLVEQGIITVDHLIKRNEKGVKERGPLFKIAPKGLSMLFPPSETYNLHPT